MLYVSSHAWPFYPGTGALQEAGEGDARGFTVNLPMPMGCGDGEYAHLYREIVVPIGRAFDPELVLVSAGFDAHRGDPLAGMRRDAGRIRRAGRRLPRDRQRRRGGRAVFVARRRLRPRRRSPAAVLPSRGSFSATPRPKATAAVRARLRQPSSRRQRRFLATWWPIG